MQLCVVEVSFDGFFCLPVTTKIKKRSKGKTKSHHHSTPLSSADQESASPSRLLPHPKSCILHPCTQAAASSALLGQSRRVSACRASRGRFEWRLQNESRVSVRDLESAERWSSRALYSCELLTSLLGSAEPMADCLIG
jgi:hypothetical protein